MEKNTHPNNMKNC